jgi:UDP-N-acetyl-D-glucosamine dehydrogenase
MWARNAWNRPQRGSKVCVLGVAYTKDMDDPRESPALVLIELLQQHRAVVSSNDRHIPRLPHMRNFHNRTDSAPLTTEYRVSQDCLPIATDNFAYGYHLIVQHAPPTGDTRNATKNVRVGREKICNA